MAAPESLPQRPIMGFVGAGVVGGSLALALSRKAYRIAAVASRTFASAQALADRLPGCAACRTAQEVADVADVVFLTTPDDAIATVASSISWRPGQGVVHCSGAASLDVFEQAIRQGAIAGAFHPLQAFSSVENGVNSIPGITFAIEGDPEMQTFLKGLARALGGNPVVIKSDDKALYHVAAVLIGGLLTEYVAVAAQLWEHLGISRADGLKALLPMMRQVSVNLDNSGIPEAVAGPYVRGDVGTVRKHLEALRNRAPELLPFYCELALAGLPFAIERGTLTPGKVAEIRALLEAGRSRRTDKGVGGPS